MFLQRWPIELFDDESVRNACPGTDRSLVPGLRAPGSAHQISCFSPSDGHHHVVLGTALTAASRSYCIDIHRKLCFCFCLKTPYYTTFGKRPSWARCDRIWMPLSHEEGKRPMKRGTAPVTCCNLGWEVHLSTDAVSLLRASPFILGPCFIYTTLIWTK